MFSLEKEMRVPVLKWLSSRGYICAVEMMIWGLADIVAGIYGKRPRPRRKPPLLHLIAIELKLEDVAGVIRQAKTNLSQAHESYCAMPAERCFKMRAATLDKFRAAGVGLLAVDLRVTTVIPSASGKGPKPRVRENHWRRVRQLYVESVSRKTTAGLQ